VFHDGTDTWTAVRNFRDRIALNEVFGKYIPSFEYLLVDLKTYRVEDIVKFNDVLSLVMLIDRMGTVKTKEGLDKLPKDYFERMGLQIPQGLIKLLNDVVTLLMNRFEYPEEEIEEIAGYIYKKETKTMFEALVKQHWRMRDEGRAEGIEEEHKRASQEKLEGARKLKQHGVSPDIIVADLGLSSEEIERL
jgi:SRSO17 transposase